ncbi:uncharacterized protein LOC134182543 [Corticium candelabrum]|uniref:uncharacterized protein LOC134182543 n=1 Tax=Corticium candelabrum TaxID=121492 RepID=UPI002E26A6D1|nr:uncharacterized protein LOC134182543 [Corticium candelabrum]
MLCVQHNRTLRSQFEFIINKQRGKTIPVGLARRLGKAVCVCHARVPGDSEFRSELKAVKIWLTPSLHRRRHSNHYAYAYDDDVKHVLKSACDEAGDWKKNVKDVFGKLRMLSVLMKVERADFSCIPNLSSERQQKQLKFEEKLKLDLKPQEVGLLIGRKGRHVKPLCKKFGADIAILTPRMSFRAITRPWWLLNEDSDVVGVEVADSDVVDVKVAAPNVDSLKQVMNDLEIRAEKVRAARVKNDLAPKGRLKKLSLLADKPEEVKEKGRADFIKKRLKTPSIRVKAAPVLENGYCVHCMSPFSRGGNEQGCCQFHKGFECGGFWSCCNERCDGLVTHEMHATTGCTLGRHVWQSGVASKCKHNSSRKGRKEKFIRKRKKKS